MYFIVGIIEFTGLKYDGLEFGRLATQDFVKIVLVVHGC